ncbi:hypothetical protein PIB30_089336, partial [Stylosanthes scabra]|nr:hypothetical protein [Stylosanthes scabra]
NPNADKEETVIVLDASEIRRRVRVIAAILWNLWNHPNLRIFEGIRAHVIRELSHVIRGKLTSKGRLQAVAPRHYKIFSYFRRIFRRILSENST